MVKCVTFTSTALVFLNGTLLPIHTNYELVFKHEALVGIKLPYLAYFGVNDMLDVVLPGEVRYRITTDERVELKDHFLSIE